MEVFKIDMGYDEWSVYLTDDEDDVVIDKHAAAEVHHEKKEVYFRRGELRLNVVLHELYHIYFGYCCVTDANLDMHQMEEVAASLFADKATVMLQKALVIYEKLKSLRDKKETE